MRRCLNHCCRCVIRRQVARMKKRILKPHGEADVYVGAGECIPSYWASHCTLDVASLDGLALSGFRREAFRRLHLRVIYPLVPSTPVIYRLVNQFSVPLKCVGSVRACV